MAAGGDLYRVMIVYRDTPHRAVIRESFTNLGFKVVTAENELQALRFLRLVDDPHGSGNDDLVPEREVRFVVIHYNMQPPGSGFELLKKIKESPATKDVMVEFVADGDSLPSDSDKYIKAGALGFANKQRLDLCVAKVLKRDMLKNMAPGGT